MRRALNLYRELIETTKSTSAVFIHMNKTIGIVDCSDLLRWQWVQVVSALDKFIHDIVRFGMVEIFNGTRTVTGKYKTFGVSLELLSQMIEAGKEEQLQIIEQQVVIQNSYKSFQKPEKIGDALSYIWGEKQKWKLIASKMTEPQDENYVKTQLSNIAIRRDQIVHEGDCQSDVPPLVRQGIDVADVDETIFFITDLVEAIYSCVAETQAIF